MKRNAIIAAAVVVMALAAVPFVYAQGMGRHSMHARSGGFPMLFGHFDRVKQALDLTDPQVEQLKTIAQELRDQNAQYRTDVRGGMHAAAQLLLADPSNVAGAQALLDKEAAAHKAMQINTLNAVSKALTVLTPDQRAKVAQFLEKRAARSQSR